MLGYMRHFLLLCVCAVSYACNPGEYFEFSSDCLVCPPGFYCVNDVIAICPRDTYNNATSAASLAACTACPSGTLSSEGSTAPTDCLLSGPLPYSLVDSGDDPFADDYVTKLDNAGTDIFFNLMPSTGNSVEFVVVDEDGETYVSKVTDRASAALGGTGALMQDPYAGDSMGYMYDDGTRQLFTWPEKAKIWHLDGSDLSMVVGNNAAGWTKGCSNNARLPDDQGFTQSVWNALGVHLSHYSQRLPNEMFADTRLVVLKGDASELLYIYPDPTDTVRLCASKGFAIPASGPRYLASKFVYSASRVYFLLGCKNADGSKGTCPGGAPELAWAPLFGGGSAVVFANVSASGLVGIADNRLLVAWGPSKSDKHELYFFDLYYADAPQRVDLGATKAVDIVNGVVYDETWHDGVLAGDDLDTLVFSAVRYDGGTRGDAVLSARYQLRRRACPQGSVSDGSGCVPCAPGTYYDTTACVPCPAGTFNVWAGAFACAACPPGTFSNGSATACLDCPVGTYSAAGGVCLECDVVPPVGPRATVCAVCADGEFWEFGECLPCPAGLFCVNASISACPPDTYSSGNWATACSACPAGTESSAGSLAATDCWPVGFTPYTIEDLGFDLFKAILQGLPGGIFVNLLPAENHGASDLTAVVAYFEGGAGPDTTMARVGVSLSQPLQNVTDDFAEAVKGYKFEDGPHKYYTFSGTAQIFEMPYGAPAENEAFGSGFAGFLGGCGLFAEIPASQFMGVYGPIGIHLSQFSQRGVAVPLSRFIVPSADVTSVMLVHERATGGLCSEATFSNVLPSGRALLSKVVYSATHAYFLATCASSSGALQPCYDINATELGPSLVRVPLFPVMNEGVIVFDDVLLQGLVGIIDNRLLVGWQNNDESSWLRFLDLRESGMPLVDLGGVVRSGEIWREGLLAGDARDAFVFSAFGFNHARDLVSHISSRFRLQRSCPAGFFDSGAACEPCSPGTFLAGNASSCSACAPGTFSLYAALSCTAKTCAVGYRVNPAGGACEAAYCREGSQFEGVDCVACEAGTYQNGTMLLCAPCAGGTYAFSFAAACTAKECPPRTVLNAATGMCEILPCDAGLYFGGTQCVSCANGTFSLGNVSSCSDCAAGTFSLDGASACSACAAGTFSTSNAASCSAKVCGVGYAVNPAGGGCEAAYCGAGLQFEGVECVPCDGGAYQDGNLLLCAACGAGTFSLDGASACSACAAGTFSTSNATSCSAKACGVGYAVNPAGGACEARLCGVGAEFVGVECAACAAGAFQDGSMLSCAPCASETYSLGGAASCIPKTCDAGYSVDASSGLCTAVVCAAGAQFESVECVECSAATYQNGTMLLCAACPSGTFSLGNASECTPKACGVSLILDARTGECVPQCLSGSAIGDTGCEPCEAGTFQDGRMARCDPCAPGTYALGGATLCTAKACDAGYALEASSGRCVAQCGGPEDDGSLWGCTPAKKDGSGAARIFRVTALLAVAIFCLLWNTLV